jgi:hypothetical protein
MRTNSGEPRAFPGAEGAQAGFPAVISQAKGQSRVVIETNDRRLCFVLLSRRFYCGEEEWKLFKRKCG